MTSLPWSGVWRPFIGPVRRTIAADRPRVLVRRHDGALAIPIRRGSAWHWTLVAAQDAWAVERNWFLHASGYATCNVTLEGAQRTYYLHRLVCWCRREQRDAPDNYWMSASTVVDHIDRDRLHNHRENLRTVDATTNGLNVAPRREGAVVPGVSWDAARGRWIAKLKHQQRTIFLGRFIGEGQAQRVVERHRRELARKAAHVALVRAGVKAEDQAPF